MNRWIRVIPTFYWAPIVACFTFVFKSLRPTIIMPIFQRWKLRLERSRIMLGRKWQNHHWNSGPRGQSPWDLNATLYCLPLISYAAEASVYLINIIHKGKWNHEALLVLQVPLKRDSHIRCRRAALVASCHPCVKAAVALGVKQPCLMALLLGTGAERRGLATFKTTLMVRIIIQPIPWYSTPGSLLNYLFNNHSN